MGPPSMSIFQCNTTMGLLSRENRRAWRGLRQFLGLRAGTLVYETEHAGGRVSRVKKPLRRTTRWSTAAALRRTDMGGRRVTCQPSDLRTIDAFFAFFQVCGGTADCRSTPPGGKREARRARHCIQQL